MKDPRLAVFRATLTGLIESLDATLRIATWSQAEAVPDALTEAAAALVERLGVSDRLAGGFFRGTVADTARVETMLSAMRRLDAAYVTFRRQRERVGSDASVAVSLDAEIAAVRADATWQ